MPKAHNLYEEQLKDRRAAFKASPVMNQILSWRADPVFLELFVIHYCTLTAGLAEPVAGYIRTAGERCKELGFNDMVPFFQEHSEEEEGHYHWAADDTARVVEIWNRHRKPALDAEALLNHRMSPAVKRYHQLHEDVIFGNAPYAELAIDLEIELIAVKYGPKVLLHSLVKLGPKITSNLSFLRKHVRADYGHTKLNLKKVDALLTKHPEYAPALVEAGKGAIDTFYGYLEDCFNLAQEQYKVYQTAKAA